MNVIKIIKNEHMSSNNSKNKKNTYHSTKQSSNIDTFENILKKAIQTQS